MPALARPPVRPPDPPPEPPPGPAEHLRAALAGEIGQRAVEIVATPSATILRMPAARLFAAGSASLARGAVPVLERVGQVVKGEMGPVRVLAFTDNQPSRTVQFPSNFALSTARAQAVRAVLGRALGEPGRVVAEGRAEADPVAANGTAEGREANRRVEIVLQRTR
ncbi:MAG: hypothetical protein NVSMB18_28720 [Acetobacteraceae bacterium]